MRQQKLKTSKRKSKITPEQFRKLPVLEQRKLIAKDALAQLRAEKYVANHAYYITTTEVTFKAGDEVRDVLIKQNPTCYVCAKGALFLSQIRLANKLKFEPQKSSVTLATLTKGDAVFEILPPRSSRGRQREDLRYLEPPDENGQFTSCLNAYDPIDVLVFPRIMSDRIEHAFEYYLAVLNVDDASNLEMILKHIAKHGKFTQKDSNTLVGSVKKKQPAKKKQLAE